MYNVLNSAKSGAISGAKYAVSGYSALLSFSYAIYLYDKSSNSLFNQQRATDFKSKLMMITAQHIIGTTILLLATGATTGSTIGAGKGLYKWYKGTDQQQPAPPQSSSKNALAKT